MISIENTAYYLPLPTKVFAHLSEAPNNNLYTWERVLITSSLDYGTPLYRSSIFKKVAALDLPQNKVYSIVASIWDLRLTKEEFWSHEKLQSLRGCPCEEHVSFPLVGEVRTLLNVHHSRDLTRSQRKLLTHLIAETHQCATDLFDLIHGICPDRADVVHRSLVSLATIDASSLDHLIALELKEVTGGVEPKKWIPLEIGDQSSECSDSNSSMASLSPRSLELFNSNSRSFFMAILGTAYPVHLSPEQDPFKRFVDLCSRGHVFQLLMR